LPQILQSWKSYTGRWAMAHNVELGLGFVARQVIGLGMDA